MTQSKEISGSASGSIVKAIFVCGLGYFIDVYDIQLYAVLRVPSLKALGVPSADIAQVSGNILNMQMAGMILGALLWGWLGDRYGRVKALYGSILLYSMGTFACAFVQDPHIYGLLRFITALGLAGEVGAAVVLVSELMPAQNRGWGITIIGAVGFLGPVAAVLTSFFFDWRQIYGSAGVLGLILLLVRTRMTEPSMFERAQRLGSIKELAGYLVRKKFIRPFLLVLIMSLPLTFAWNILNFFSMELSQSVLANPAQFSQKVCLLVFFIGTSIGDILSGIITQLARSRRKAMASTLAVGWFVGAAFLALAPIAKIDTTVFYVIYFVLGLSSGCWALATLIASEHFGINIRATASLLMLNLLRGSTIPMVMFFQLLKEQMPITQAALWIGLVLYIASFSAMLCMEETHGKDLDFNHAV